MCDFWYCHKSYGASTLYNRSFMLWVLNSYTVDKPRIKTLWILCYNRGPKCLAMQWGHHGFLAQQSIRMTAALKRPKDNCEKNKVVYEAKLWDTLFFYHHNRNRIFTGALQPSGRVASMGRVDTFHSTHSNAFKHTVWTLLTIASLSWS